MENEACAMWVFLFVFGYVPTLIFAIWDALSKKFKDALMFLPALLVGPVYLFLRLCFEKDFLIEAVALLVIFSTIAVFKTPEF